MATSLLLSVTDASSSLSGKAPLTIVRFEGQLDESNVDEQAQVVEKLLDAAAEGTYMVFDLGGLTYMNSKSIGFLTGWHLKMAGKKGEILLARAQENILDILNVVGLTQIIRTYATIDEAMLAVLQQLESRGDWGGEA